jgi:PIN domain nuclease of toxin-antitoxin system
MGVSYLLDSNALIWLGAHGRSPRAALVADLNSSDAIYVSAASAFELATKHRIGKLPQVSDLLLHWPERIRSLGAAELAITSAHAVTAGALDWDHRDPFDRLLVAQARCENLTLVSADRAVLAAPGVRRMEW